MGHRELHRRTGSISFPGSCVGMYTRQQDGSNMEKTIHLYQHTRNVI